MLEAVVGIIPGMGKPGGIFALAFLVACGGGGGDSTGGPAPTPVPLQDLVGTWDGEWTGRDMTRGGFVRTEWARVTFVYDATLPTPGQAYVLFFSLGQGNGPAEVDGQRYRASGFFAGGTFDADFAHFAGSPREVSGSFRVQNAVGEQLLQDATFRVTRPAPLRLLDQWEQGGWLFQTDVTCR